jgi:hypothetical protein
MEKISQYTADATSNPIQAEDLLDFSNWDGAAYDVSKKILVSELLTYLNSNITNIYNADGTILADRTLTAGGNFTKWLGGDVVVQMVDEAIDYAFLVRDNSATERARLGYDQATLSGELILSSLAESNYLVAQDGRLLIGTPTVSTAKVHIKGLDSSVALRVDGDNRNNVLVAGENAAGTSGYVCVNTATQFSNALLTVNGNMNIVNSLSFGAQAFVGNAISMPTGYQIQIGGTTRLGEDTGTTYIDAGADHIIQFRNASNAVVAYFDNNVTAGNTRLVIYDVDNGTLERVSVGVADSGGVGFKVLRIPN